MDATAIIIAIGTLAAAIAATISIRSIIAGGNASNQRRKRDMAGSKFGGNRFGGNKFGGNKFGGLKVGKSAPQDNSDDDEDTVATTYTPGPAPAVRGAGTKITAPAKGTAYAAGPAPAVRGAGKVPGGAGSSLTDTASASESAPKKPGPFAPMGSNTQQRRGSAKASPGLGATTGSIDARKPSVARKAQGDDYLKSSSTDYGLGSAVNSFVNKPKKK